MTSARLIVVDETIDPADERFRLFDPVSKTYCPGYWMTTDAAREAASHIERTQQITEDVVLQSTGD